MAKPFATARRATSLYQTSRWRKERAEHLEAEPYCRACRSLQRMTLATVVDHIQPPRGDEVLFWDRRNWQSLCKTHSDQKTGQETRARMNPSRPRELHPGLRT